MNTITFEQAMALIFIVAVGVFLVLHAANRNNPTW